MIEIVNGNKSFKDLIVFNKLNLNIHEPGLYFIKGESGSGKSTLLNLLAGYDSFDSGMIEIDENIATIFQNYELIKEMNIEENIFLQVNPDASSARELLDELGLVTLLKHYPNELSGGQKQRVGIARALLLNPNIILCDEPTESLDVENKNIVMTLLKNLAKDKIVIVASHDSKIIDTYADQVFYLEDKKLITKKEYNSLNKLKLNNKKTFNSKDLSNYVRKIINKRNIMISLFTVIITTLLQILFLYGNDLFYIPTTKNVLNADIVYLESLGLNEKFIDDKYTSILKFKEIIFNNEEYEFNVYPYIENTNKLQIDGEIPKGKGIIVNQNVLKTLNISNWENLELEGIYLFDAAQESLSFKIIGVIHEDDTNLNNIYYNLNDILAEFDTVEYSYGLTKKEYLLNYGMNFQTNIGFNNIETFYEEMSNSGNVFLKSPLYEERLDMQSGIHIFKFMYSVIEIVLFIIAILFISISTNYDSKLFVRSCTILCSQGINLKDLKQIYVKQKMIIILPLTIIETLLVLLLWPFKSTEYYNFIIVMLIAIITIVIYIISILINVNNIKNSKISSILKDE